MPHAEYGPWLLASIVFTGLCRYGLLAWTVWVHRDKKRVAYRVGLRSCFFATDAESQAAHEQIGLLGAEPSSAPITSFARVRIDDRSRLGGRSTLRTEQPSIPIPEK